jgi:hypothetical protein
LITTTQLVQTSKSLLNCKKNLPSTFRKTFKANTLLRSSSAGLASLTSHTRAKVPTAPYNQHASSLHDPSIEPKIAQHIMTRKQNNSTHPFPASSPTRNRGRSRPSSCGPDPCSWDLAAPLLVAVDETAQRNAPRIVFPAERQLSFRQGSSASRRSSGGEDAAGPQRPPPACALRRDASSRYEA